MRLIRTATYRADLEEIANYIAAENPRAALAVWDEIESQVERLAAFLNRDAWGVSTVRANSL